MLFVTFVTTGSGRTVIMNLLSMSFHIALQRELTVAILNRALKNLPFML